MRFITLLLSLAVVAVGVYLYMKSTGQPGQTTPEAGRQAVEQAEQATRAMQESLDKQQQRMQDIEK